MPPVETTVPASEKDILGVLPTKCDPDIFLGLFGVLALVHLA
jgi:hypothetical protein